MSNPTETPTEAQQDDHSEQAAAVSGVDAIGAAFGREDVDPWAAFNDTFRALAEAGTDPFEEFIDAELKADDPTAEGARKPETISEYRRHFRQFTDHMAAVDPERHPACINAGHVESFVAAERARGNKTRTIKGKLASLRTAFDWFVAHPKFPHGADFDPFKTANPVFEKQRDAEYPHVGLEDARRAVRRVTHIRDRAIIVLQLTTGMRAGEIRNAQLQDLNLSHAALRDAYPALGTHPRVGAHPEAIYIPSKDERDGNKSAEGRTIPLTRETREALVRYLLTRPTVPETPWVFLGRETNAKLESRDALVPIWQVAFPESEWGEGGSRVGEGYRPVHGKSHYGRHFFVTWWSRGSNTMDRDDVRYLRGDTRGASFNSESMDTYIHRHYEDIEEKYRSEIFSLGL